MTLKSILIAGVVLASLGAPLAASADPAWGYGHDRDGWHGAVWNRRDDDWRGHEWREHAWREREAWRSADRGWGYGQRCYTTERGFHAWDGDFVSRPVTVCR